MKIYLATMISRIKVTKKADLNLSLPIINHLESYFYLKNKGEYLKVLKKEKDNDNR